ncbi:MAG TPA: hypothetical protein VFY36_06385 [Solirubrobacteraceae bacterium]|nr:hypothetical protein [Solirubrobacteraceae bacterium]
MNGNHEVLALIAGLTLPPLAVACVWLLALGAADLIAATVRRPSARSSAGGARRRRRRRGGRSSAPAGTAESAQAAAAKARADSRKLAA